MMERQKKKTGEERKIVAVMKMRRRRARQRRQAGGGVSCVVYSRKENEIWKAGRKKSIACILNRRRERNIMI